MYRDRCVGAARTALAAVPEIRAYSDHYHTQMRGLKQKPGCPNCRTNGNLVVADFKVDDRPFFAVACPHCQTLTVVPVEGGA